MWTKRTPFIDALIKYFEEHEMGDLIGFNEPYSASTICAYTTGHYAEHYGLPTAIFEVRQDLLTDSTSVEHWTHVIKTALLDVMRSTQLIS